MKLFHIYKVRNTFEIPMHDSPDPDGQWHLRHNLTNYTDGGGWRHTVDDYEEHSDSKLISIDVLTPEIYRSVFITIFEKLKHL